MKLIRLWLRPWRISFTSPSTNFIKISAGFNSHYYFFCTPACGRQFEKIMCSLNMGKKSQLRKYIESQLRGWGEALVIAGVIVAFARTFFFQIYRIPTTSMVPTLMPGDKIFVSRLSYGPRVPFSELRIEGFGKPQRGEVIVFVPPYDRKKAYIKRLIGLPKDEILIKDGNIYINGEMAVDPRKNHYYYNQGDYAEEGKPIVVPEGRYFFLGDNSISSSDSRYWGFVEEKDIVGKAILIWWPPKRMGMIE